MKVLERGQLLEEKIVVAKRHFIHVKRLAREKVCEYQNMVTNCCSIVDISGDCLVTTLN